ncbi:ABC transporter permease [Microbispora sp. KK1-11]|uniref:ABC transporter permease n=1 Tax=Microbispora sp. KK1-11 TaxID=2053005 RepID=UPI001158FE84|nr:ABC transporter permease [Microbispora sp. KK1-11]TQS22530.1 ABC transporter permease [Microbispora sp. KK1-11]
MARYLTRRLAQAVLVLWAAFTLSFAVLYLLPGDPIEIMTGGGASGDAVDPAQIAALRHEYGFDRPLAVQYLERLAAALHGDFGRSVTSGTPVLGLIRTGLPATLTLTGLAVVLAVPAGAGLALLATYTRMPRLRRLLLSLPSLGVALPSFWVGLVLLQVVSFRLRLLPSAGDAGPAVQVLPAVTLAVPAAAALAQVLARGLDSVLRDPYVETAHAKGAGRLRVHLRHVAPNALIPTLTLLGLLIGELMTNAVVVETVFSRDGLGRITATAVGAEDIPVVQGVVVVSAVVVVVVNLLVDLAYPLLDPRIVLGRRAS